MLKDTDDDGRANVTSSEQGSAGVSNRWDCDLGLTQNLLSAQHPACHSSSQYIVPWSPVSFDMRQTPPQLPRDTDLRYVSDDAAVWSWRLTLGCFAVIDPQDRLSGPLCPSPQSLLVTIRTHGNETSAREVNDEFGSRCELFL